MRYALALIVLATIISGCKVRPSKMAKDNAVDFAQNIQCVRGYKNKCWCFVASTKNLEMSPSGMGVTLAPDELCE
jgi:hypothetical protein